MCLLGLKLLQLYLIPVTGFSRRELQLAVFAVFSLNIVLYLYDYSYQLFQVVYGRFFFSDIPFVDLFILSTHSKVFASI